MSRIVCLLSSPTGYASTSLFSYDAVPADFIVIKETAYLLPTICATKDTGKNGRRHNYWVCNLPDFFDTTMPSANDHDRKFPKWILYSLAENHRDTDQLTAVQCPVLLKQILEAD